MADIGDFSYYYFVRDLPEIRAAAGRMEARMRVTGNPVAADGVAAAYATLIAGLEALSAEIAARATVALREHERSSRVRPDTAGDPLGGPRLEDFLVAEPLSYLLPGSVGLNDQALLNANVPWWSTNEEGSSARVGKVLYGVFEPGESAPDPVAGEAREHPLFQPMPSKGAPSGRIKKPIPERRFVQQTIATVLAIWRPEFERLDAQFRAEVDAAVASAMTGVP